MKSRIYFTHIPKTAGTTFKNEFFYSNFHGDEIIDYSGIRKFAIKNKKEVKAVLGHFAYGLHYFDPYVKPLNITFFREPTSRVVSHYYWVLQSKYPNYIHPDWHIHNSTSLNNVFSLERNSWNDFFRMRDNMQCRYLAGIFNYNIKANSGLLKIALRNLENYYVFGIQDEYVASIDKIGQYLNIHRVPVESKEKLTFNKPIIDEDTIRTIREYNKLDMELYDIAKEKFYSL